MRINRTLINMYNRNYKKKRYYGNSNRFRSNYGNYGNYGNYLQNSVRFLSHAIKKKKNNDKIFENVRYPALDKLYVKLLTRARGNKKVFNLAYAIKRDITSTLETHLKQIVVENRNLICMNTGKPGLGKSVISLCLYDYLKRYFWHYREKKIFPSYAFNFDESKKKIKRVNAGDVVIQDEFNELSGEGARSIKTAFMNLVRSFRYTQKSFILNNVDYFYIAGLNLVISPIGHDERYYKTKNPKYMRTKALIRYIDDTQQNKRPQYLGYVWLDVNRCSYLFEDYEKAKHRNYKKLEKSGGMKTGGLDMKQFEKEVKLLLDFAKEQNWNGKSKKRLKFFLRRLADRGKVSYDTNKRMYLIDEAYIEYHKKKEKKRLAQKDKKKEKEEELQLKIDEKDVFHVEYEDILETITNETTNWKKIERDKEIFRGLKDGMMGKTLAKKHGISQAQVSIIKNKINGYINKKRGELYEIFHESQLKQRKEYEGWEIIRDGSIGKPDIYAISPDRKILQVFSIKCYNLERDSYSIPIKECKPEIEYAKENHEDYDLIEVFFRGFDHQDKELHSKLLLKIEEKRVLEEPPKTIIMRK